MSYLTLNDYILVLYRYETVLSNEERQRFRKLVIAMILATDLKASYEVIAIYSNMSLVKINQFIVLYV